MRRLLIQLYINLIEQSEVVQPASADEGVSFPGSHEQMVRDEKS